VPAQAGTHTPCRRCKKTGRQTFTLNR
ncbi:MAG: hypothetical protein JZU55_18590, partial [Afipia sp.]|nr:hypothetical protein [Afipia sp.]